MTSPPSPAEARQRLHGFAAGLGDDIATAAELGTDLILTCLGQAALSYVVARGLGVPAMGAYVVPSVPSAQLVLPRAQVPPGAGPAEILASGQQLLDGARAVYADVLPGLAARVGLPARAADEVWDGWLGQTGRPIYLGYSPAVVPRPADWARERGRRGLLVAAGPAHLAARRGAARLPRRRAASGLHRVRQHGGRRG